MVTHNAKMDDGQSRRRGARFILTWIDTFIEGQKRSFLEV